MESIQKLHNDMNGVVKMTLDLERLKGPDFHPSAQVVSKIAELIDSEVMDFADLAAMAISSLGTTNPPAGTAEGWYKAANLLEPISPTPEKRHALIRVLYLARQSGLSWTLIDDCVRWSCGYEAATKNPDCPDRGIDDGEGPV